ncbi:MAG: hypothetical protein ABL876_18815 [Chitinophagaceae bacterium]
MKYINFTAALLVTTALLTGCGSESAEQQTESQPLVFPVNNSATPTPQNNTVTTTQNSPATSARPVAPVINANNTKQQPISTAATTAGLNPAHGQPGHRCDIAVGAPLNSAPAVAQQPAAINNTSKTQTIASPVVTKTNPVQTTTATGLNPAHGQPGHRCDIAVGAPLNSKPVQQPTVVQQPAVSTTPQKTYISEAQKMTPPTITTAPTVVAEGMNPEHGKPGHRCDIAVGAPLNSKPKQ